MSSRLSEVPCLKKSRLWSWRWHLRLSSNLHERACTCTRRLSHTLIHFPKTGMTDKLNKTFLCDQQLQWNLASQKLDEHSMLYFTNTLKSWIITTLPYVQYLYPQPMLPLLQRDLQWLVFRCSEGSLIFWSLFVKELTTCPWGRLEDLTVEQTGLVAQDGIPIFLIIPCLDCPLYQLVFLDFPDKRVNVTLESQNIFRQVWEAEAFGSLWV